MSREIQVSYINSETELEEIISPKEGDIAIEKSNAGIITSDIATHKEKNKMWQYIGNVWTEILSRESYDPSNNLEKKAKFSDEELIQNVSKIRKAHMDEVRTFIDFVQRMYSKRYGDVYFNTHDYSNAILNWPIVTGKHFELVQIGRAHV